MRKTSGSPIFNRQAAAYGAGAIFLMRQQRNPVVVEVADVLVGEVVDGVLQVAFHPGMLRLCHQREKRVLNIAFRRRVRRPEPELPQSLDAIISMGTAGSVRESAQGQRAISGRRAKAEKCCAKTRDAPQRVRSSSERKAEIESLAGVSS